MARLTKNETHEDQEPGLKRPKPSDVREILNGIAAERSQDAQFAGFFMREVAAPCHWTETPQKRSSGSWDYPYRERLIHSFDVYLSMSETDRRILHAANEDGVRWRGEDMRTLVQIVDETLKMREVGIQKYIQLAKEGAGNVKEKIIVKDKV